MAARGAKDYAPRGRRLLMRRMRKMQETAAARLA